jgi:hypothetical protein
MEFIVILMHMIAQIILSGRINMNKNLEKTQIYSTWGDKLLQHTDVLYSLQIDKQIKPITIQLAPVEVCDSDCPFCSVAGRPLKSKIPFEKIVKLLKDFKSLGAKSVEITGGGNPLLYRDEFNGQKKDINDIIEVASDLGFDIGIITNSHNLSKSLKKESYNKINWLRISLIQLDEGREPEEYFFNDFPEEKLAFSYIIYESTGDKPDSLSRTKKPYIGTTTKTIQKMAKLVQLHPNVKFVRIAGNCLIKGNNADVRERWKDVIKEIDTLDKFFIKDIGYDDDPYNDGCYVGGIRPYIAPNPHGADYQVYICTSHVLQKRTYDIDWSLGSIDNVLEIWHKMSENLKNGLAPYQIKGNDGKNWCDTCKYCYYKFNNKLLHTVVSEMPDKNFP